MLTVFLENGPCVHWPSTIVEDRRIRNPTEITAAVYIIHQSSRGTATNGATWLSVRFTLIDNSLCVCVLSQRRCVSD